ncbi:MAG: thiol:disulfide interchange protein DsbD [Motiliproteus sp.]
MSLNLAGIQAPKKIQDIEVLKMYLCVRSVVKWLGLFKGKPLVAGLMLSVLLVTPANADWWESLTGPDEGPLAVEDAYHFSYSQPEPGLLVLDWEMPDGYYLYRDKIQLHTADKVDVVDIKKGAAIEKQDPIYGRTWVYFNSAEVRAAIQQGPSGEVNPDIQVEYQGCRDGGICYPPVTKTLSLKALPQTAALLAQAPGGSPPATTTTRYLDLSLTDQQPFVSALSSGGYPLTLLLFFVAGLALSLTPCVFPMIPILSTVIVGHQGHATTRQAFVYSCVYVLFMALTYTLAGIAAGLFGANIQAAFQNPWIISAFSVMFVAFALSMFGFFEIQVPAAIQNRLSLLSQRQRGGRLFGVAVMGVLSALIVGPCVAAPLAGALVYIGQTGDPILGGAALFSLSLGMGLPLIAIGTSAGKLLPKAGHWMVTIKAAFGVLMLLMAIWMLDRIVPAVVTMLLLATVLVITAIYLKVLERLPTGSGRWPPFGKGIGVLLLVYGVSLLLGAAAGNTSLISPLAGVLAGESRTAQPLAVFTKVTSLEQLQPILASAKAANQPVMLDFYADWCVSCKELEAFVFVDAEVQEQFRRFTLIKVDVTANDAAAIALNKAYGLIGPPALILYDQQGLVQADRMLIGVPDVDDFVAWLKSI